MQRVFGIVQDSLPRHKEEWRGASLAAMAAQAIRANIEQPRAPGFVPGAGHPANQTSEVLKTSEVLQTQSCTLN